MEFSYRVSEAEYLVARKLRLTAMRNLRIPKTIILCVFILVCLMLLWDVVRKTTHHPPQGNPDAVPTQNVPVSTALQFNAAPFLIMIGISFAAIFVWVPIRVRRAYRNDPSMQGEFTVEITPSAITTRNTAGTGANAGWNIYEFWSEAKSVIILVNRSGSYFILSLSGLAEAQRDELRSILSTALPKK